MPVSKKKKSSSHRKTLRKSKSKRNKFIYFLLLSVGIIFAYFLLQPSFSNTGRIAGTDSTVLSELYVSTQGNDNNPGTQSSPFASINKAAHEAKPGTRVHVAPGTYNETIITTTSGTAEHKIYFISDEKWGAKIKSFGNSESTDSTWENNGSFVEIKGFDISGGKRIGILNRGSNVTVSENYVHDIASGFCSNIGGAGIDTTYSASQTGNNLYIGNLIENVGAKPCSYVHGIYLQEANESAVNNIINNVGGIGIACTHACNNTIIANNTIINSGYGIRLGWSLSSPAGKTNNALIANNIIMGNLNYALYQYLPGIGTGNTFTHNVFFGNKTNGCSAPTGSQPLQCSSSLQINPQFLKYASLGTVKNGDIDVHLNPQSPAINAGTSIQSVISDFDNNPRPSGTSYDIGAFEYTTTPLTPTSSTLPTPFACSGIGDINNDNSVTSADALLILRYLAGLEKFTDEQKRRADTSGNKSVELNDVRIMREYISGTRNAFPACTVTPTPENSRTRKTLR